MSIKGYYVVKKTIVWNVRIKAFWYINVFHYFFFFRILNRKWDLNQGNIQFLVRFVLPMGFSPHLIAIFFLHNNNMDLLDKNGNILEIIFVQIKGNFYNNHRFIYLNKDKNVQRYEVRGGKKAKKERWRERESEREIEKDKRNRQRLRNSVPIWHISITTRVSPITLR